MPPLAVFAGVTPHLPQALIDVPGLSSGAAIACPRP
jgi:hypothetical protein